MKFLPSRSSSPRCWPVSHLLRPRHRRRKSASPSLSRRRSPPSATTPSLRSPARRVTGLRSTCRSKGTSRGLMRAAGGGRDRVFALGDAQAHDGGVNDIVSRTTARFGAFDLRNFPTSFPTFPSRSRASAHRPTATTMIGTLGVRYEPAVQTARFRPYVSGGLGLNHTEQELWFPSGPRRHCRRIDLAFGIRVQRRRRRQHSPVQLALGERRREVLQALARSERHPVRRRHRLPVLRLRAVLRRHNADMRALTAWLVLLVGLAMPALAQDPPARATARSPTIDATKLGVDLSRIQKGLRVAEIAREITTRRPAPRVFRSRCMARRRRSRCSRASICSTAACPAARPVHNQMIEFWTPPIYRTPAMPVSALAYWAAQQFWEKSKKSRCEEEIANYRALVMQGVNVSAPRCTQ